MRLDEGRKGSSLLAMKVKARTVVGRREKNLLSYPLDLSYVSGMTRATIEVYLFVSKMVSELTGLLNLGKIVGKKKHNRPFFLLEVLVVYPTSYHRSCRLFHSVIIIFFFFSPFQFVGEVFELPNMRHLRKIGARLVLVVRV